MADSAATVIDTRALYDVYAAAAAFVAMTSFFRQPKEVREQFERLAEAVLKCEEIHDGNK